MKDIITKTMDKEFVPYEQALELKQLGFDEPCLSYYDKDSTLKRSLLEYPIVNSKNNFHEHWNIITAPLYQQVFRWFREKFNLHILIDADVLGYYGHLKINPIGTLSSQTKQEWINTENYPFKTYEEVEIECLKKLIEIVKEKK
jgi:hypothetical protein